MIVDDFKIAPTLKNINFLMRKFIFFNISQCSEHVSYHSKLIQETSIFRPKFDQKIDENSLKNLFEIDHPFWLDF